MAAAVSAPALLKGSAEIPSRGRCCQIGWVDYHVFKCQDLGNEAIKPYVLGSTDRASITRLRLKDVAEVRK